MARHWPRYEDLFENTIWWVVPVLLVGARGVRRLPARCGRSWASASTRRVVKGVIVATVVVVGAIALLHPGADRSPTFVTSSTTRSACSPHAVTLPASVIALFLLLALALLLGARFIVHLVVEGRVRSFRVAKGARDVLIVGGGEGGRLVVRELVRNPQLRLRPVGFVDDDPRKRGIKDEYGLKVLGTTDQPRTSTGCSTRSSPTRS